MIIQLQTDLSPIESYTSASDAAKKTGISLQGIRACLKEDQQTAGGFRWIKLDQRPLVFKPRSGKTHYIEDMDEARDHDSTRRINQSLLEGDGRWSYAPLVAPLFTFDPKFDIYDADIKKTSSLGKVHLSSIKKQILNPDPVTKDTFTRIEIAEIMKEWEIKAQLKSKLKFITPCAQTDGVRRSYAHVTGFTGLVHLDFDHIKEDAPTFRDAIFEYFPFVVGAWLSASRKGVKVLVRIPEVNSVPEFKEYYWGIHHIVCNYIGYDPAPQNAVLPLFLSHDPDARFREYPAVWDHKGTNPHHGEWEPIKRSSIDFDSFTQFDIIARTVGKIDRIEDNGHPQLRAAVYTLGGFVGAGYVDPNDAENAVVEAIERNDYLSKGTDGYIKTARQMLEAGSKAPLEL